MKINAISLKWHLFNTIKIKFLKMNVLHSLQ